MLLNAIVPLAIVSSPLAGKGQCWTSLDRDTYVLKPPQGTIELLHRSVHHSDVRKSLSMADSVQNALRVIEATIGAALKG